MSLVRLGKRDEAEVHKVRREEGLVRPKKGQDAVNFASDESFSIETRQQDNGRKSGWLYMERLASLELGISNHPIGRPLITSD